MATWEANIAGEEIDLSALPAAVGRATMPGRSVWLVYFFFFFFSREARNPDASVKPPHN